MNDPDLMDFFYGSPDDDWYKPVKKEEKKTEPEVEDRIGLREEKIDWNRFKKFRDTM